MEKYERLRMLGKGSFGKAWLVRDKATKKEYVAKEIATVNKLGFPFKKKKKNPFLISHLHDCFYLQYILVVRYTVHPINAI